MNALRFVPAESHHARLLAGEVRERDAAELALRFQGAPQEIALRCIHESSDAWACFYEADLLALYGVSPLTLLGGSAQVWLICTRAIERHPRAFARASVMALYALQRNWRTLTNFVDTSDAAVLRWLDWLGAELVLEHVNCPEAPFQQFILSSRTQRGAACRLG